MIRIDFYHAHCAPLKPRDLRFWPCSSRRQNFGGRRRRNHGECPVRVTLLQVNDRLQSLPLMAALAVVWRAS